MTLLLIVGAITLTIVLLWPLISLIDLLGSSDYGVVETMRNLWRRKDERMYLIWTVVAVILWYLLVARNFSITVTG